MKKTLAYAAVVLAVLAAGAARAQSAELTISIAQLPGMADSPEKGVFVDIVKALDEEYTEGKIVIEVYPFGRSFHNVLAGAADAHIPSFVEPGASDAKFPYSWLTQPLGPITLVLYSQAGRPLTKKDLDEALAKGGKFPYVIEVAGGTEPMFPFPTVASNDFASSFRKLEAKRIDAMIAGPGAADKLLRQLELPGIHRGAYADFDDIIVVAKSPRGEAAKKRLEEPMKRLARSGRLEAIYARGHKPFEPWQPADMGW
jgi:polar amino acid transport system substrate-binding protein